MKEEREKEENCPLCKVSKETLKKLEKAAEDKKNTGAEKKELKRSRASLAKNLVLIFIIAGLGALVFYFTAGFFSQSRSSLSEVLNEQGLGVGNTAVNFISEDIYGDKISLNDFRGKKSVLLVFWATWCSYCAKELPTLNEFAQDYKDKIQVTAIASGESKKTIEDYIKKNSINFSILLDEDRKIWNHYLVRGTPSHFLIDQDGIIAGLRPGLASKENLENFLTMLKK